MAKRATTAPPPAPESAIDKGQIRRANRRRKRRAERFDAALRTIMATTEGAIVLWELLGRCGVNQTVMSRGIKEVLYMAGRQDVGHSILADMVRVDSDLYVDLERAMRTIDQREEQEEIAARTPSVTKGPDNTGDED